MTGSIDQTVNRVVLFSYIDSAQSSGDTVARAKLSYDTIYSLYNLHETMRLSP
jgi:hypothetical protein